MDEPEVLEQTPLPLETIRQRYNELGHHTHVVLCTQLGGSARLNAAKRECLWFIHIGNRPAYLACPRPLIYNLVNHAFFPHIWRLIPHATHLCVKVEHGKPSVRTSVPFESFDTRVQDTEEGVGCGDISVLVFCCGLRAEFPLLWGTRKLQ
ncbi:hypothetical protein P692DRAFT_20836018 [Suillus brevipes Sb2]|nr:hypothetical protein P692DRAFT_20836018 [Suillus brevipes Sb2]